jgi:hypothetical protein
VLAGSASGFNTEYQPIEMTAEGKAALKPGQNLIAAHCHQTTGGQFIDIGIANVVPAKQDEAKGNWSEEKAWAWYRAQPWRCGFNYVPSNAISYTEMWMGYNFDPALIDREFAVAQKVGFNCTRVVLPYVVWAAEPEAFKKRMDQFLTIADRHGIAVMFAFFDDCAFGPITDPVFGKQPAVVDGWYANGWTPSPGHAMVRDESTHPQLKKYVQDVMSTFKNDSRVWIWDLYNEPMNSGMGDASIPLVLEVFDWGREINPSQPLSMDEWSGKLYKIIGDQVDVVTFHNYEPPQGLQNEIDQLKKWDRPVICTEWLNRNTGSTVADCLPIFKAENVGAICWGLVNGRTQTNLNWGHKPGDPEPKRWQHDLFRGDLTAYDAAEIELFHKLIGQKTVLN